MYIMIYIIIYIYIYIYVYIYHIYLNGISWSLISWVAPQVLQRFTERLLWEVPPSRWAQLGPLERLPLKSSGYIGDLYKAFIGLHTYVCMYICICMFFLVILNNNQHARGLDQQKQGVNKNGGYVVILWVIMYNEIIMDNASKPMS